jgi:hypothetical protein
MSLAQDARTTDGRNVAVQLAPTYSGTATSVVREDNAYYVWSTTLNRWFTEGIPGVTPSLQLYAGQFNAPGPTGPPVSGAGYGYPYGDHLLELPSGGPLELSFLTEDVDGVWFEISNQSGVYNDNFDASVEALDSSGHVLGTYSITATGSGGVCASLKTNPPTPCNDSPEIGFYDPEGRIASIYISVTNTSGSLTGFAIDGLTLDEVPEPSIPLMIVSGLAAFSLWRRRRRTPSR